MIKFLLKPSAGQVDSRPELQPTNLPHGDGREKSAGMPGSKKKYLFPHVMSRPSLHTHVHSPSIIARVIRVLALTSCCSPEWWNVGEEAVRVLKRLLDSVFVNWLLVDRKAPEEHPNRWVWVLPWCARDTHVGSPIAAHCWLSYTVVTCSVSGEGL